MSATASSPSAVRNVRPWGGPAQDVVLADGRIVGIRDADPGTPVQPGEVDGRGLLALPGLVKAHAHVDKSRWGLP